MHRITTAPVAPIPARTRWAVAAGAGAALAAAWWLGDTAPYPYAQRGLLDVPLPFLTAGRMDAVLRPRPGERMLKIGPGTGLQSLHVAPQLGPEGRLDVLDIQQEMLDHVMCRAERDGLATITPTRSDARELPYADGTESRIASSRVTRRTIAVGFFEVATDRVMAVSRNGRGLRAVDRDV
ncbi:methyltransferase domain-containing protein [Streptomyces sp. NBC_01537]|uniref:methyltransferase domain-containing protein n=1 Tax=Streptomyces sp. NBC_01537 TaxID=2903896 RepID=UPI00386C503C